MTDEENTKGGSLMSRLRAASEERRREEEQASRRERSDQEFYQECLRPAMLRTYRFLEELLQHIEYLGEKVEASYEVPGIGTMDRILQSHYHLRADTLGDIRQIKLRFECEAPFDFTKDLHGAEQVRTAIESLERLGMMFSRSREKRTAGIVEEVRLGIRQRFTVVLLITADQEQREIVFRFRNFEGYGDRVRHVKPADLDDEALDELAKYILREPSSWAVAKVDEKMREQLRRNLEKDRNRKTGGGRGGFFR